MKNIDKAMAPEPDITASLTAEVAHNYIRDMLAELAGIADTAQLGELSALLNVTLQAVDIKAG